MLECTPTEIAAQNLLAAADGMGATSLKGAVGQDTLHKLDALSGAASLRTALSEIADLGSCGAKGGFQRALDIATTALSASGMEGRRAAAENTDAVHDSPTGNAGDAQKAKP